MEGVMEQITVRIKTASHPFHREFLGNIICRQDNVPRPKLQHPNTHLCPNPDCREDLEREKRELDTNILPY